MSTTIFKLEENNLPLCNLPLEKLKSKSMPKPTLKQKRFAQVYVQTANATEAAMQVYDCNNRHTAQAVGSETLSSPIVQIEVAKELHRTDPSKTIKRIEYWLDDDNPVVSLKAAELLGKHQRLFDHDQDKADVLAQVKSIGWNNTNPKNVHDPKTGASTKQKEKKKTDTPRGG